MSNGGKGTLMPTDVTSRVGFFDKARDSHRASPAGLRSSRFAWGSWSLG